MKTFPNQNVVIIKKTSCKSNFLQISNDEWMAAAKLCGTKFAAFKLYLYLAANEVGYKMALSKAAVEKAVGIKQSNYYNCIGFLEENGFLRQVGKNTYEFYTIPYIKDNDSIPVENSIVVENSIRLENYNDSIGVENSTGVEKVNTFNF